MSGIRGVLNLFLFHNVRGITFLENVLFLCVCVFVFVFMSLSTGIFQYIVFTFNISTHLERYK